MAAAAGTSSFWDMRDEGSNSMDWMGLGTMEYVDGSRPPEAMYDVTLLHLHQGFRHLDCAEMYESTPHVGRAITESGIPREKLCITTKLKGLPSGEYSDVCERAKKHLQALGISYADLLLVHFPGPADNDLADPEKLQASATWEYFAENIASAWQNMQLLKEEGLALQIGVSNFYSQHLELLESKVPGACPFANEIYLDATHHEADFVNTMQAKGIKVIAYRPVAFAPVYEMAQGMGDNTQDVLNAEKEKISAESVQQLVLAWLIRRGCHVLVKTGDEKHVLSNIMATTLAGSPDWSEGALAELAGGSEMATMCGAGDECAAVFRTMGAGDS